MTRFKEEITPENITISSNGSQKKLCDHLENHEVPCGRGSGDSIQICLLALLNIHPSISQSVSTTAGSSQGINATASGSHGNGNNIGKRGFLNAPRLETDKNSRPYTGPILSTAKRKFETNCKAHEVPEHQWFSVLHVMFRDEAERYYTDHIAGNATSIEDAFQRTYDHFVTPAHQDTYTTV